jgi:hypothetical protein
MSDKMILYSVLLTGAAPECCAAWIASASASLQRADWAKFLSDFARGEKQIPREKTISWDRYKNGTFHLFFLYEEYWRSRDDLDMDYSIDLKRKMEDLGQISDYFEVLIERVLEASRHVTVEPDEWAYLKRKGQTYRALFKNGNVRSAPNLRKIAVPHSGPGSVSLNSFPQ